MRTTWRTVRVFISSTFRDMNAERDHLVRFVFPRLRQALVARRIHLVSTARSLVSASYSAASSSNVSGPSIAVTLSISPMPERTSTASSVSSTRGTMTISRGERSLELRPDDPPLPVDLDEPPLCWDCGEPRFPLDFEERLLPLDCDPPLLPFDFEERLLDEPLLPFDFEERLLDEPLLRFDFDSATFAHL